MGKTGMAMFGLVGLAGGVYAAQIPPADQPTAVLQGGVARWSGMDATACGIFGKRYAAVEGVCYYPIDLGTDPGTHEIALTDADGEQHLAALEVEERDCTETDIELPDDSYLKPSPEDLARSGEERARMLDAVAGDDADPAFQLPLAKPVEAVGAKDRSDFCEHRHYHAAGSAPADTAADEATDVQRSDSDGEGPDSRHTGLDYPIGAGTAVGAVADGKVALAEEQFFTGNSVVVDHGDGLVSMVFHMDEIAVKAGDVVKRGDELGTVGATGRATGPHLHIGARWQNQRIDPAVLFADPASLPGVGEASAKRKVDNEKEKVEKKTDRAEEAALLPS